MEWIINLWATLFYLRVAVGLSKRRWWRSLICCYFLFHQVCNCVYSPLCNAQAIEVTHRTFHLPRISQYRRDDNIGQEEFSAHVINVYERLTHVCRHMLTADISRRTCFLTTRGRHTYTRAYYLKRTRRSGYLLYTTTCVWLRCSRCWLAIFLIWCICVFELQTIPCLEPPWWCPFSYGQTLAVSLRNHTYFLWRIRTINTLSSWR